MTDTKHTPILDVDIFTDLYVAGLASLAQRGDINFPAVMSDIHDGTAHKFSAHIVKCVNMYDELVGALKQSLELANIAEGMTGCKSDDEYVWGVQNTIRRILKKAGAL